MKKKQTKTKWTQGRKRNMGTGRILYQTYNRW